MKIQLSDHFTYKRLFRFSIPSIVMMIFTSIYSVVDGLFVSNIVGSNALSSINIVVPMIIVVGAFGFMLGAGGSAEVARTMGEGKPELARKYFTMIIIAIAVIGIALSVIGIIFMRPIAYMLGASELLIEDSVTYGTILMAGCVAYMMQSTFQTFFITAEKPKIGLILTTAAGITNIVLDFLFVYVMEWGIAGAAAATVCGFLVGGIFPIIYFLRPNKSLLQFAKTKFYPRVFLHSCINGSSEMMTEISMSIITFLYNWQMMRLIGENGVAAITVIMYVNFVFVAIFIGYSIGTAPIVGYNYGAENHSELKNMFRKNIKVILISSVAMTILAELTAVPLVNLFVGHEHDLAEMTIHGFRIYSLSFLVCGINIFASSFFTALCNGKLSALISFLRSLVLQAGMIILLPVVFDVDGIWMSVVVAEVLTAGVSLLLFKTKRKKYGY